MCITCVIEYKIPYIRGLAIQVLLPFRVAGQWKMWDGWVGEGPPLNKGYFMEDCMLILAS